MRDLLGNSQAEARARARRLATPQPARHGFEIRQHQGRSEPRTATYRTPADVVGCSNERGSLIRRVPKPTSARCKNPNKPKTGTIFR
jgi:hypothetical protein